MNSYTDSILTFRVMFSLVLGLNTCLQAIWNIALYTTWKWFDTIYSVFTETEASQTMKANQVAELKQ